MKKALLACLLLLCCLCTHRATAQEAVRLLPGDCLDRPFMGVDTATYRATVLYVQGARQALADAAAHIGDLEHEQQLTEAAGTVLKQELGACRTENVALTRDLGKAAGQVERLGKLPLRPPLVLDGRVYKVGGLGLLFGLAAGFFLHK